MEEQKPPQLQSQPAVMRATISITRAATGKVETFEIVGTPIPEPEPKEEE